jgi:hypothetical protein
VSGQGKRTEDRGSRPLENPYENLLQMHGGKRRRRKILQAVLLSPATGRRKNLPQRASHHGPLVDRVRLLQGRIRRSSSAAARNESAAATASSTGWGPGTLRYRRGRRRQWSRCKSSRRFQAAGAATHLQRRLTASPAPRWTRASSFPAGCSSTRSRIAYSAACASAPAPQDAIRRTAYPFGSTREQGAQNRWLTGDL